MLFFSYNTLKKKSTFSPPNLVEKKTEEKEIEKKMPAFDNNSLPFIFSAPFYGCVCECVCKVFSANLLRKKYVNGRRGEKNRNKLNASISSELIGDSLSKKYFPQKFMIFEKIVS